MNNRLLLKKKKTQIQESDYLRPNEAMELFNIKRSTFWYWVSIGKIHTIKRSERVTTVSKRELDELFNPSIKDEIVSKKTRIARRRKK
ncbi:MAG: helix-turn-helix domain-containing protein [Campylobacterales bacterium]|nr:helix-turn-helix domain-containing protein [Campylobacterales bacterium]